MRLCVFVIVAAAAISVQLTSAVHDEVFSSTSQSLAFLPTGEELYAIPTLQTYSILFWLQLHSPLPSIAPVLSLTSKGESRLCEFG